MGKDSILHPYNEVLLINVLLICIVALLGGIVYNQVVSVQRLEKKHALLISETNRVLDNVKTFNELASKEINKLQDFFTANNIATLNLFASILGKQNPTGELPSSSAKE